MLLAIEAICFSAVVTIVSVEPVSGFALTASIALTTDAPLAKLRLVCVNTSTLVSPESTFWRGNTGQA